MQLHRIAMEDEAHHLVEITVGRWPVWDLRPKWELRRLLFSLLSAAALVDPRRGGGGAFDLALLGAGGGGGRSRRGKPGPPKKQKRKKKTPVAAGSSILWMRSIQPEETWAKFDGPNWELLSYAGEDRRQPAVAEWHRMTRRRISDLRAAWRAGADSLAGWEAENPAPAELLTGCGRRLHECLPEAEAAEVAACRRLLAERPLPGGFRLQGSLAELWSFQTGSDLDLVRCWPRDKGLRVVNLSPGLCQLRSLATVERVGLRCGLGRLLAPHRRFSPEGSVTRMLSPGRFRRRLADWRLAGSRRGGSVGGRLQERGPAVTQAEEASEVEEEEDGEGDDALPSVDFVCSVRLAKWPRFLTTEWLPRHCRRHLFSASQARVHVVPIGRQADSRVPGGCTHAWRYSYHELEAVIARGLAPPEGACYGLMKAAHRRYLKPKGYKSYHVKIGFLWLRHLEEPETWQGRPDRLLWLALLGLALVMQCARQGYMPNYFMPNENVMRHTLPTEPPASLAELATFLADAAGDRRRRVTAVDRRRLAAWLDLLSGDIAASAGDLAEAASAGCYCRVDALTGRSLEWDCGDCDRLLEWDCATQTRRDGGGREGAISGGGGLLSNGMFGRGGLLGRAIF